MKIKNQTQTILYYDNKSTIYLANNPVFHEKTKHVEIDCHFIRDLITQGTISLRQIGTKYQLADMFTKPLGEKEITSPSAKLEILNIYSRA